MRAYCIWCRGIRDVEAPVKIQMKNNKVIYKGKCAECGNKVYSLDTVVEKEQQ